MLLHGIFPPITTPFYPDGKVYFKKLEANLERYSKTPVAGIVVLGSTGEAILLSDEERREVLKTAREATAPHKVLVAGTGIESASETLELTEYAASLGYDVAMVRTPHYYKNQMKPANMLAFYRTVADRSPLPVIIYNFPQATGYDIPAEVVIELAGHPNLIGIKESSGDVEKVRKMVEKTRQKEVGFQVLVGAAQKLEPSLQAGAVGAILAFADAAPTACYEIYAAWKEGDTSLAREKQERIVKAAQRVVGELSIPGVKYAMDFNGYYGGVPRLPLLPLTADLKSEVEQLLTSIRN